MNKRLLALAVIVAGALASALLAWRKGRSFLLFLLLGLSFWPGALLVALLVPRASVAEDRGKRPLRKRRPYRSDASGSQLRSAAHHAVRLQEKDASS